MRHNLYANSHTMLVQQVADKATKDVLIIYAGGTIGCTNKSGEWAPMALGDFTKLIAPILEEHSIKAEVIGERIRDSAKADPDYWYSLATTIASKMGEYRGVVVLHGTDTLAYAASFLTFFLSHLFRPVIITAAQVPIEKDRYCGDGLSNLIGACRLASYQDAFEKRRSANLEHKFEGKVLRNRETVAPIDDRVDTMLIPEVCVYFNSTLYRGTRLVKKDAVGLDAFDTPRTHVLGKFNGRFVLDKHLIGHICFKRINQALKHNRHLDDGPVRCLRRSSQPLRDVAMVRLYPGFNVHSLEYIVAPTDSTKPPIVGLVLQTFGSGNVPDNVKTFIARRMQDKIVVNCTECQRGWVNDNYEAGLKGVVNVRDMTPEAAFAKLYVFLNYTYRNEDLAGQNTIEEVKKWMEKSWRGEITKFGNTRDVGTNCY